MDATVPYEAATSGQDNENASKNSNFYEATRKEISLCRRGRATNERPSPKSGIFTRTALPQA